MRRQIIGRGMPMPSSQRRFAGTEPPLAFARGRRREMARTVPTWDRHRRGPAGCPNLGHPAIDPPASAAAAHEVSQLGTGTGEGEPGVPTWDAPGAASHAGSRARSRGGRRPRAMPTWLQDADEARHARCELDEAYAGDRQPAAQASSLLVLPEDHAHGGQAPTRAVDGRLAQASPGGEGGLVRPDRATRVTCEDAPHYGGQNQSV